MTDEMKYWNRMSRPPLSALKTIKGGRLSGMSNISPQWRWQIMTEMFGMVGFGWKYTVEKKQMAPAANDEHFAFVDILLYVKVDGEWSAPIPGSGGSMLISKEQKGMHNNDEAFKMAETDALGTAMAKIGVGADIYLGTFDGSKYNEPQEFPKQINTKAEAIKAVSSPSTTNAPTDKPEIVKDTKELAEGYTGSQILNSKNGELVKELVKLTGKKTVDVCKFIGTLEKGKKFTVGQVVKMVKGEAEQQENQQKPA